MASAMHSTCRESSKEKTVALIADQSLANNLDTYLFVRRSTSSSPTTSAEDDNSSASAPRPQEAANADDDESDEATTTEEMPAIPLLRWAFEQPKPCLPTTEFYTRYVNLKNLCNFKRPNRKYSVFSLRNGRGVGLLKCGEKTKNQVDE